ncbi:uncharacterized protein BDV17DRAFT_250911 [Aspergillus undulatus]|uniref:uncharacterized protein n=1 Tax=Aspergillus undulatus TaxID=1810928 RepID=UPI003CCCA4AA
MPRDWDYWETVGGQGAMATKQQTLQTSEGLLPSRPAFSTCSLFGCIAASGVVALVPKCGTIFAVSCLVYGIRGVCRAYLRSMDRTHKELQFVCS